MARSRWIAILFAAQIASGFQSDAPLQLAPAQSSAAVTNPQPTVRPEPKYSEEARAARIQGKVLVELYVDTDGVPQDIRVLRPIGFGLDEAALAAAAQWRFQPGTKDGQPVRVSVEIEIGFRLVGYNATAERQAALYNKALFVLKQGEPDKAALESLRGLVSEKYAPGIYLYGRVLTEGWGVPADRQKGLRLLEEAADKHYGPALYEVAMARLQGSGVPKDPAKAMDLMRSAAHLGSPQAQVFLGHAYEKGENVAVDLDKSRQNYRLCAASGNASCQFRLGKSLLEDARRQDRDRVQAIAYLQLASSGGNVDAGKLLEQEAGSLTPSQLSRAKTLAKQLVQPQ